MKCKVLFSLKKKIECRLQQFCLSAAQELTNLCLLFHKIGFDVWPIGYKTFFMLNSAEHEIFSANKYENANNSWHFHIY